MDPLGYPISATTTHHVSAAEEFNWSRGVPVSDAGHGIGVSGVASTTMNTMPAVTDFLSGARYPMPHYSTSPHLDQDQSAPHSSPLTAQGHFSLLPYEDGVSPHTPGIGMPYQTLAPNGHPILAPNPVPRLNGKRSFPSISDYTPSTPPQAKRRKSTSKDFSMTEDDTLLLKLKDEENLPWKTIAKRFFEQNRGEFKVPTLQMRYKRLKEKMRVWDQDDLNYLQQAKESLDKEYWELLSKRMVELGCKKKIPGSACEKKWKELGMPQGMAPETPRSPPLAQMQDTSAGLSPQHLDDLREVSEER